MRKPYHVTQIKTLKLQGPVRNIYWFDVELHEGVLPVTRPQVEWEVLHVDDKMRGYLIDDIAHSDYVSFLQEFVEAKEDEVLGTEIANRYRAEVIADFTDKWALNDRAHRIEHFQAVEAAGLHINRVLGLACDPVLIMAAAFFHDLFAWSRDNHERLSCAWVATTEYELFAAMDHDEMLMVSDACLEHRASYKGEYSTHFSALIASADRGFPGDVQTMLARSELYHNDALKITGDAAREGAIKHIKEKFGSGGYAQYPDLYEEAFGPQLAAQRKEIDAL